MCKVAHPDIYERKVWLAQHEPMRMAYLQAVSLLGWIDHFEHMAFQGNQFSLYVIWPFDMLLFSLNRFIKCQEYGWIS